MIFFMLTDILSRSTELLYCGSGAETLIEEAFGVRPSGGSCQLADVVSRKKQLIPSFMERLQNS